MSSETKEKTKKHRRKSKVGKSHHESKSEDIDENATPDELRSHLSKSRKIIKQNKKTINALESKITTLHDKFTEAQERIEDLEQELENRGSSTTPVPPKSKDDDSLTTKQWKKLLHKKDARIDQMELLNEEFKHNMRHYQTKFEEQQQMAQRMRQKYESLNVQYQHQSQRLKDTQLKIKAIMLQNEAQHQQRIDTIHALHDAEVKALKNQLEIVKRQQNESRSKESEDIRSALHELEEQHETIEQDLQKQIDDTKEMMLQREKAAQQVIDQLNSQYDGYKETTENEIIELKQKIARYEVDGSVEVILTIDVDGSDATTFEHTWQRQQRHNRSMSRSVHSVASARSGLSVGFSNPLRHVSNSSSGSSDFANVNSNTIPNGHRQSVYKPPPKKPAPLLPIHTKDGSVNSYQSYHSGGSSNISDLSNPSEKLNLNNDQQSSKLKLPNLSSPVSDKRSLIQKANPLTLNAVQSMDVVHNHNQNPNHHHTNKHQYSHSRDESQSSQNSTSATPNSDILSRMKSKILSSFAQLPHLDATSPSGDRLLAVNTSGHNITIKRMSSMTPSHRFHKNGVFPKKPGSVRSAYSGYSGGNPHSPSGSIISGSDVDRYIAIGKGSSKLQLMMYQQDNAKLAENLKMAHQKNMVMKEQSQRKYKQLQLTLQAERAAWKSKNKEYTDKIQDLEHSRKENETLLTERVSQLRNLENQFNSIKSQFNMNQQQMQQANSWQEAQSSSNRSLVQQVEHYRVQLSQVRQQLLAANNTLRQQNDAMTKMRNKLALETKNVQTLRAQIEQRETTSAEELLEQQVKLLKNQRRMLIHEVRDLREANERLKNMVVTGGLNGAKDDNNNDSSGFS